METIFTKIIKGEIPSYFIAENEYCYAFLDISPVAKGHVLVVSKLQNDYIFDLPNDILTEMTLFSKKIALAIQKAIPCERVGVAVIGLEVPHTHIHLIPISNDNDLDFTKPRLSFTKEEMVKIAAAISKKI